MKTVFVSLVSFIAAAVLLLAPFRTRETGAYPENLWTSNGQWSRPAIAAQMFRCERTEVGLIWPWLVYDKGISEDAWYLKLDQRVLVFNVLVAASFSISCVVLRHRILIKP